MCQCRLRELDIACSSDLFSTTERTDFQEDFQGLCQSGYVKVDMDCVGLSSEDA